jgi:hypothetical protein
LKNNRGIHFLIAYLLSQLILFSCQERGNKKAVISTEKEDVFDLKIAGVLISFQIKKSHF